MVERRGSGLGFKYSPGLNASVARLARASLQQKNIRANVDTLAIKPEGEYRRSGRYLR